MQSKFSEPSGVSRFSADPAVARAIASALAYLAQAEQEREERRRRRWRRWCSVASLRRGAWHLVVVAARGTLAAGRFVERAVLESPRLVRQVGPHAAPLERHEFESGDLRRLNQTHWL